MYYILYLIKKVENEGTQEKVKKARRVNDVNIVLIYEILQK